MSLVLNRIALSRVVTLLLLYMSSPSTLPSIHLLYPTRAVSITTSLSYLIEHHLILHRELKSAFTLRAHTQSVCGLQVCGEQSNKMYSCSWDHSLKEWDVEVRTALLCTTLHCTALTHTVSHCIALQCTTLHCTALCCFVLLFLATVTVNAMPLHFCAV